MQPVAVSVTVMFADIDQGQTPSTDSLGVGTLGHKQDLEGNDFGTETGQEIVNFFEVIFRCHHKLELIVVVLNPSPNDLRLEPPFFVAISPSACDGCIRG